MRLETRLTTATNCQGDRFTARVIEPSVYEGAIIQGHIAKIERSGRMTGRTEMTLDFDAITLRIFLAATLRFVSPQQSTQCLVGRSGRHRKRVRHFFSSAC